MRYERKFIIKNLSFSQIKILIKKIPFYFKKHYPDRIVNNIYLDSIRSKNYNDNVIGIADRKKYRVRWYGRDKLKNKDVKLEKKIKNGWVGTKEIYKVDNLNFSSLKHFDEYFYNGFKKIPKKTLNEIKNLSPTLMNSYSRTYFRSICKKFRITIDRSQEFYHIRKLNDNFFYKLPTNDNYIIIELKYDVQYDVLSSEVTNALPFPISKNSKYINGIDYIKMLI